MRSSLPAGQRAAEARRQTSGGVTGRVSEPALLLHLGLELFDDQIMRSTTAIDHAVSEKASLLTNALQLHSQTFRETIAHQASELDDSDHKGAYVFFFVVGLPAVVIALTLIARYIVSGT